MLSVKGRIHQEGKESSDREKGEPEIANFSCGNAGVNEVARAFEFAHLTFVDDGVIHC